LSSKKAISVLSADTHNKPYTWSKYPLLRGDAFFSFQQIVSYCIACRLPLILAGDILDERRPDAETVGFVTDQMNSMADAKLPVYFIQGQHDMSGRPWLKIGQWPTHVDGKSFEIGGIKFYGIDFVPKHLLAGRLEQIPDGTDVVVMHQVWEEFMGRVRSCEGALRDVPKVKMVITGDFHRHDRFKINAADGRDLVIVSPGSTNMRTLDEDPHKYFYVLYDDLSVESVPLKTRHVYRTRFASEAEVTEALLAVQELGYPHAKQYVDTSGLPSEIQKPIWDVEFYETVPDVEKRVMLVAGNKFHVFVKCIRPDKQKTDEVIDEEMIGGLRAALIKEYDPQTLLGATALRLLDAVDLRQEIDKICQEVEADAQQWSAFGLGG